MYDEAKVNIKDVEGFYDKLSAAIDALEALKGASYTVLENSSADKFCIDLYTDMIQPLEGIQGRLGDIIAASLDD